MFPQFNSKKLLFNPDPSDVFYVINYKYQSLSKQKVSIDEKEVNLLREELAYFFKSLTSKKKESLPLQFGSLEEEVGFIFLLEALRFGSRFDRLLEERSPGKRNSHEVIQFGLISSFISGKSPQFADFLVNCTTAHQVGTVFEFPVHESQPLEFAKFGGVYKDVEGPLSPFANQIARALNEMGILLRARQMNHLGELVSFIYSKSNNDAWNFANQLAKLLPITFGDEIHEVPFLCKAQRIVGVLVDRFPENFHFKNLNRLTALVDANLIFGLRKLGVLKLSENLEKRIDSENPETLTYGGDVEFALRIAAMHAVHLITQGKYRDDISTDWLIDKSVAIVHQRFRIHQTETLFY